MAQDAPHTANENANKALANLDLKIGTYNIRGQGAQKEIKLRKIKNNFDRGKFNVLFVQETRTSGSEKELKRWQKVFNSKQIFLTSAGTESVGAGIVIRDEESFTVRHSFIDPEGRYVGLVGDHEDSQFLLLSFYSPYVDREIKDFVMSKIYETLNSLGEQLPEFVVLGGDTNTVFSNLDKEGGNITFKRQAINAYSHIQI